MPEQRALYGEDGRSLARVRVCRTARARRKGLLGVAALGIDDCILLVPCRSIHTVGMKMPIDVAYLDRDYTVLATEDRVLPRKLFLIRRPFRTRMVLEGAAGAFAAWGLRVGERLRIEAE